MNRTNSIIYIFLLYFFISVFEMIDYFLSRVITILIILIPSFHYSLSFNSPASDPRFSPFSPEKETTRPWIKHASGVVSVITGSNSRVSAQVCVTCFLLRVRNVDGSCPKRDLFSVLRNSDSNKLQRGVNDLKNNE